MASKKLAKPRVALARQGYKFVLSFGNIDRRADYIHIEREVFEEQDKKKGKWAVDKSDHKREKKKASISSWSYTLNKEKYYPFVSDGGSKANKESDLSQRIAKIVFKVWVTGKVKNKTWKSDVNTVTYKFAPSVNPSVGISYEEENTSFVFAIDINDDYSINDNTKKVATRCWGYLTSEKKGGKAQKVTGYTGRWYNRDTAKQIRGKIATTISPDTPVKYTVHAYSAGPGGKSDEKTASHCFARPKVPKMPTVKTLKYAVNKKETTVNNGFYEVSWDIDTDGGWRPVDNVTIQYRDQKEHKGASDIYGEDMGDWSVAKDNINSVIRKIRTDDLGAVADDSARYFRLLVEHDGIQVPSWVTGVVAYGKPSNVSGVSITSRTIYKSGGETKTVPVFKWTNTTNRLYNFDEKKKILRILIFKNSTGGTPIKTINYRDPEWLAEEWVYEDFNDYGNAVKYCFKVQVGVGTFGMDEPGAVSDNLWTSEIVIPNKITNVNAVKMANNTSVELTWDSTKKEEGKEVPIVADTVSNGIEVAWSTIQNAWESNEQPSTTKFENSAMTKAYIVGLTEGEIYYFWVRRYEENDGEYNYGIWSDTSPGVLMSDKPNAPVLTTSRTWIKEGGNLAAQWVYSASGNLPQSAAQVEVKAASGAGWKPIATVDGADDQCTINLGGKVNNRYTYPAGEYQLRVVVNNSVGKAESEPVPLRIATKPSCTLGSDSISPYSYGTVVSDTGEVETTTVDALRNFPLSVNVSGSGELNLFVYCMDNFEWEHPDRTDDVYSGDCVWTSSVASGGYLIENLALADNAHYRLQLECVDQETLLLADPQYIDFEVHWEHQAVAPENSTVTINEDGTATLVPVKPEGALDTDVCDIYRTTADGRYLCRENVKWGQEILDVLPTFGTTSETAYCFCTRTTDGDEAWIDIPYELGGSGIIINFSDEVLALPWNVTNDDSRTKQGEIRAHLGGSRLYFGQPYIDRKQSLSTEIVQVQNEDLVEQLYRLSRHTELCYVRTSNCIGYPATVDVSINREYNKPIVSVSLSATEVDSDGEFLANDADNTE